jgi:hypothetical protein
MCDKIIVMVNPLDDFKIDDTSSTPQNEFDDWFSTTHKNTRASWDIAEDDDSDDLDIDHLERDEDC